MHTIIATAAGLIFLALWLMLARSLGWHKQTISRGFTGVWALATLIHGAVGISHGQSLLTELAVGLVIFGVPTLALSARQFAWLAPVAREHR